MPRIHLSSVGFSRPPSRSLAVLSLCSMAAAGCGDPIEDLFGPSSEACPEPDVRPLEAGEEFSTSAGVAFDEADLHDAATFELIGDIE